MGACSTAALLVLWPHHRGVVWTPSELQTLGLAGLLAGGVLGGALAAASYRAGLWAAAVVGLAPMMMLAAVPWLPTTGRVLEKPEPTAVGVLLGAVLVFWGVARTARHPALHALLAVIPVAVTTLAWPSHTRTSGDAPPGPDLLLITVDTTRADLIAGFAADLPQETLPALAAFSAEARRYPRAYAPTALTGPSHTTILSGRTVSEHGIVANGRALPPLLPRVPVVLQHRGWHTRAFVSTAVLDAGLGFDLGFDDYDSRFENRLLHGHPLLAFWPRRKRGGTGFVRPDAETVDLAVAALRTDHPGPTFTWVHLYGPHWPYEPTADHAEAKGVHPRLDSTAKGPVPLNLLSDLPDDVRDHAIALYRAELHSLDDQLQRLLDAAPHDTRVVIAADHGESLDEHGLWFNHGRLATAPTARVPVWVRGPGHPPGEDHRTVGLHQLAATLLALAEADATHFGVPLQATPEDAVVVTLSAASVFPDDHAPRPEPLGDLASLAVRSRGWTRSASLWHPVQWTEFTTDPRDLSPRAATDVPEAVRADLEAAWQREVAQQREAPEPVDPSTQEALEVLGYVEPTKTSEGLTRPDGERGP